MTFLPRSHRRTELRSLDLTNSNALFDACPDLQWDERVTMPLRAGDCTFHHGRCAHMATPNLTDEPRVAHVMIYMDESTLYQPRADGQPHPVTDPLGLIPGAPLDGELFPIIK